MKSITIFNSDSSDSVQIHSSSTDLGYWVRAPIQGLESPSMRTILQDRAEEHGSFFSSSLYGSRVITLEGTIAADAATTYESRRSDLEEILKIERNAYGIPQPKILKFTTMDDLNLQVKCIVDSPLQLAIDFPTHGRFAMNLIAADHFIEAQSASSSTFSAPADGGFILAIELPITFTASTNSNKTITNAGNGEAYPILTFNGPLTNPRMQNSTTGRGFGITQTLTSGQAVVVNMRDKTVVQDGVTNVIGNKTASSKWWALEPGANDIFFASSDSSEAGTCVLSYRDSYIGV